MKIFIGADHGGFELKTKIYEHLVHRGLAVEDVGAKTLEEEDDYPKYAYALAVKVLGEEEAAGILLCKSGQGMAIAANRVRGIRAGLAWDVDSARWAKTDDNCNVLVLPAKFVDPDAVFETVDAWLDSDFKADPKYQHRLDEIEELYG